MDTDMLKTVAQAAGIGGIALGALLYVFRDIIRKQIFPMLDRKRGYQLLRLVVLLIWSIALVGIVAWVWVETSDTAEIRPVAAIAPAPAPNVSIQSDRSNISYGDMIGNTIIVDAPTTIQNPQQGKSE